MKILVHITMTSLISLLFYKFDITVFTHVFAHNILCKFFFDVFLVNIENRGREAYKRRIGVSYFHVYVFASKIRKIAESLKKSKGQLIC